jgi:hypothetical protein
MKVKTYNFLPEPTRSMILHYSSHDSCLITQRPRGSWIRRSFSCIGRGNSDQAAPYRCTSTQALVSIPHLRSCICKYPCSLILPGRSLSLAFPLSQSQSGLPSVVVSVWRLPFPFTFSIWKLPFTFFFFLHSWVPKFSLDTAGEQVISWCFEVLLI